MEIYKTKNGNLKCKNKGCLKEFNEDENGDEVCNHHPGNAVFHDLKKYYTCCKIETWDWD